MEVLEPGFSSQDTKSGLEGGEYGKYKIYLYTDTSETQKPRPQAQDRYPKCGGHSRMGTDKSLSSVADAHTLMVPRLSQDCHGGHWDKWNCHSGISLLRVTRGGSVPRVYSEISHAGKCA